jgi:hypothetical protein
MIKALNTVNAYHQTNRLRPYIRTFIPPPNRITKSGHGFKLCQEKALLPHPIFQHEASVQIQ